MIEPSPSPRVLLRPDDVTVVLVKPGREVNIGGAARAMKTMGFQRLVLVQPQIGIGLEARAVAHGSVDILEQARIVDHLGEAVAGCGVTAGLTAREGKDRQPPVRLRTFVNEVLPLYLPARVALVFGSEESGLSIEDLEHCQFGVRIPTGPVHHSLNLSHAVMVACYEMHEGASMAVDERPAGTGRKAESAEEPDRAREERLQIVYRGVESFLKDVGYPNMSSRARAMADVRRILGATHFTRRDASTLLGLFRHVRYVIEHNVGLRCEPDSN